MGELAPEKALLFVLIALPGVVAIRSYALWLPSQQRDWKEALFDAVFYSMINFFLWAIIYPSAVGGFFERVAAPGLNWNIVKDYRFELCLYTLVTPLFLTWLWYKLRIGVLHTRFGMDHPIRTGWDWVIRNGGAFYIRFVMKRKDGDKGKPVELGGYFADMSFAATYPQEPEIYVQRLHQLKDDGSFGDEIEDSKGMVIKLSECERVEIMADPHYAPPETWTNWLAVQPGRLKRGTVLVVGWTGSRISGVTSKVRSRWLVKPTPAVTAGQPESGGEHVGEEEAHQGNPPPRGEAGQEGQCRLPRAEESGEANATPEGRVGGVQVEGEVKPGADDEQKA